MYSLKGFSSGNLQNKQLGRNKTYDMKQPRQNKITNEKPQELKFLHAIQISGLGFLSSQVTSEKLSGFGNLRSEL